MKRNKILALIGAGVLSMGVVGVALATELQENQAGQTIGDILEGQEVCDDFDELDIEIGDGEIGLHFILTQPESDSGTIDVVTSTGSANDVPNTPKGAGALHFYVVVTGDMDSILVSAETDVTGDNLVLSHACAGDETTTTTTTTTTTSFSSSEESTTDTETTTTAFSSSEQSTSKVTQPPTDTIGANGSGQQSSGLWMLLAALGVLAGSVIVLAPSKAKSKD
jgi:hypothetical protein